MSIKTYPKMDRQIVELLELSHGDPVCLYAAQRIRELEAEVDRMVGCYMRFQKILPDGLIGVDIRDIIEENERWRSGAEVEFYADVEGWENT